MVIGEKAMKVRWIETTLDGQEVSETDGQAGEAKLMT